MFKIRNVRWIIVIILLLSMLVLAFNTRKSFIKDTDVNAFINNYKDAVYGPDFYEEDGTKSFTNNDDISSLEKLEEISPIIVRVQVDPKAARNMYYYTTLTKVNVKEVYKGKLDKDSIYIFEPFDVLEMSNSSKMIYSLDGYNLMDKDTEYILFLRDIRDSNYTDDEKIYMPTTTALSKFPVNNNYVIEVNKNLLANNALKYKDINKLDIISSNKTLIDQYNNLKDDIVSKYINQDIKLKSKY